MGNNRWNGYQDQETFVDGFLSPEGLVKIKRLASLLCGAGFMIVGGYFSATGFGFRNENMVILGVVLAIAVAIIEMIFQNDGNKDNDTITLFGIGVYFYDWFTNFVGILLAYNITSNFTNPDNFPEMFMAFWAAVMFSWLPEPMISWGLTGKAETDFVKRIKEMLQRRWASFNHGTYNYSQNNSARQNQQSQVNVQYQKFNNQPGKQNGKQQPQARVIPLSPEDEARVNAFHAQRQNGKQQQVYPTPVPMKMNGGGMPKGDQFQGSSDDEIEDFLRRLGG